MFVDVHRRACKEVAAGVQMPGSIATNTSASQPRHPDICKPAQTSVSHGSQPTGSTCLFCAQPGTGRRAVDPNSRWSEHRCLAHAASRYNQPVLAAEGLVQKSFRGVAAWKRLEAREQKLICCRHNMKQNESRHTDSRRTKVKSIATKRIDSKA